MPTVTTLPYRARPVHKPTLTGFDLDRFSEGLAKLYTRLPESLSSDRHDHAYVQLVLEVARKPKPEPEPKDAILAKDFATYFLERTPAYSTTRAGISALLFETWLVRYGGEMFGLFLETVLLSDSEYLAIFTGSLTELDLDRLRDKVAEFASFDVSVRAGDRDYKRGLIADVTMLTCKAVKNPVDPAKTDIGVGVPTEFGGARRIESLLPSTRDGYERVVSEGGLSTSSVPTVFGCDPFSRSHFANGRVAIEDTNGVTWLGEDGGRRWIPVPSTLELHESRPNREPKRRVREALSPGLLVRRETIRPIRETIEPLYETSHAGALRSHYGSWALFEAPVEGGPSSTVVVVRDRAWTVQDSIEDVTEAIGRIETMYAELPPEFDVMVEAFLGEYAEDLGTEVSNPAELSVVLESTDRHVHDRDDLIEARRAARLREAGLPFVPKGGQAAAKPAPFPPKGGDEEGGAAGDEPDPNAPPLEPPEPAATSDHMDDPPFYREDMQGYYDLQITTGMSKADALARVRRQFKVTGLLVTPAGEVRAPGVIDRPKDGAPPPPPPPAIAAPPPAAEPEVATGGPISGQKPAQAPPASSGAPPAQESLMPVRTLAEFAPQARETLPVDQQLQLPTVDDAFMYWLVHEDGDVDDFEDWLGRYCPHLADALEVWQPSDVPLVEGRLQALAEVHARRTKTKASKREKRKPTVDETERYDRWKRLVNMPARSLRRFLASESFREALSGPRAKTADLRLALESARRTFVMKATPIEEWTGELWNWCGRQTHFISRLRGLPAPLIEQGRVTRKYLTLKAWGHDPAVPGVISEAEVIVRQRQTTSNVWTCPHCQEEIREKSLFYGRKDEHGEFMASSELDDARWFHRACHGQLELPETKDESTRQTNRLIDALPGCGPRALVVGEREEPDFDALKRNRTKLSDDERELVLREGAVWTRGPKGEATPAVWKSHIGETTWYVTNTHRAFRACSTIAEAIRAYHRTIRATA